MKISKWKPNSHIEFGAESESESEKNESNFCCIRNNISVSENHIHIQETEHSKKHRSMKKHERKSKFMKIEQMQQSRKKPKFHNFVTLKRNNKFVLVCETKNKQRETVFTNIVSENRFRKLFSLRVAETDNVTSPHFESYLSSFSRRRN